MVMQRLPARFRLADLQSLRRRFEPVESFDKMGLLPTLRQALNELQVHKPTAIQSIAIPQLLKQYTINTSTPTTTTVMSAETGSGKTLAYLLPLIQRLKLEELPKSNLNEPPTVYNYLRAAVLLPTNELVDQVYRTVKTIAHNVKLRVDKLGHAHQHRLPCDLIMTTPSRLLGMLADEERRQLRHLIVDEADTLLSDLEFKQQLDEIVKRHNVLSMVYCSATITDAMLSVLPVDNDKVVFVTTKDLHEPKPKVMVKTIVVKLPEAGRFQAIIRQINVKEKTIIFCNSAAVGHRLYTSMQPLLSSSSSSCIFVHGGIPEVQRAALLTAFKTDPVVNVMIATDLMARGLDFAAVKHVILCELPQSRADYLHRVGRVGRVGLQKGLGRVTIVIGSRQVAMVPRIVDGHDN